MNLSIEDAHFLQKQLQEAIYTVEKEQKRTTSFHEKIRLKDLQESIKNYTLNWDDVVGFDFCVTMTSRPYPEINKKAKLLLKKPMIFSLKNEGFDYESDFHWMTSYVPDIEKNFLFEQVRNDKYATLEDVKNCLDENLIQYVIQHPDFQLKWDSKCITASDLQSDDKNKVYYFG